MDLGLLYQRMFNAVVSGGTQKILNAAYEAIKLPLIVVDTSYNVLAVTDPGTPMDNIWNSITREKRASPDLVWLFYKEKYIESVCNSSKPVYLNWGSLGIPQISGAIRVSGIIRAYIGVVCPASEFKEVLIEATSIIANALALDMKNSKNENTQNNPLLEIFTRDLFNGIYQNETQLDTWRSNFAHIFKKDFMVAAILPPSDGESGLLQYFSSILSSKHTNVLSTISSGILYLLYYDIRTNLEMEEIKESIFTKLYSFHTRFSVTKGFSNILDVPNYRFQVEKALELGTIINPEKTLYLYEDYVLPTVLSYCLKEMSSISYAHPIINQLADFDKKNNTDYLNTLEVYILCICDSRKTSEKLHIHRNTLLYRLNKISELTNYDFNDENTCVHLILSFHLEKLRKQLYKTTTFASNT